MGKNSVRLKSIIKFTTIQVMRRKRRKQKSFPNGIVLTILLSVVLLGVSLAGILNRASRFTLHELSIPNVAKVYLPDPLEFSWYSHSVLGAQVFDPVDIVKFVNIERAKTGAPGLKLNATLMKAAQMRATTMLRHQNFSHQDPFDDITMVSALRDLHYTYQYATENIGMGGTSGENFVFGFMHSTAHRENLLNPYLSDTGVAVVTGPYKEYYVNIAVQIFTIPGGKNEQLGYSKETVLQYRKILEDTDVALNPIVWNFMSLLGNKSYTSQRYTALAKQREILGKVYKKMSSDLPLDDGDVAEIIQFNELLNIPT